MLIGPKYKICKRLGASVFEKCQTQKFQLAEARNPRVRKGRRGGSDFGAQLLEKQKARFTYGLSETQFARYVHEAMEAKGAAAALLLGRLEARLDNVVYRAGLVKTRRAARQIVSHGHVFVNGRRLNVPSYKVEVGDVISVRPESRPSALFVGRTDVMAETKAPAWMAFEDQGYAVKITAAPSVEETQAPFSAPTIIQFYSR
jgi:small subunit ribosomal protein S4